MEQMEMFKRGRIRIITIGDEELLNFLSECEKMNILWASGESPTIPRMIDRLLRYNAPLRFSTSSMNWGPRMVFAEISDIESPNYANIPCERYRSAQKDGVYLIEYPLQCTEPYSPDK